MKQVGLTPVCGNALATAVKTHHSCYLTHDFRLKTLDSSSRLTDDDDDDASQSADLIEQLHGYAMLALSCGQAHQ